MEQKQPTNDNITDDYKEIDELLEKILSDENKQKFHKNPNAYRKYFNKEFLQDYRITFNTMFVSIIDKKTHDPVYNVENIADRYKLTQEQNFIIEFLTTTHPDLKMCQQYKDAILDGGFVKFDNLNSYPGDDNGQSYFHSLIANDRTGITLLIFNEIKKNIDNKTQLTDIIPFDRIDGETFGNKNLLMLSLIKKYDYNAVTDKNIINHNITNNINSVPFQTLKEYELNNSHYDQYHKIDEQLLLFLINNSPKECFLQKDVSGYNILDYAIIKMDTYALKTIINRAKEDQFLKQLFNESKLISHTKTSKKNTSNITNLTWQQSVNIVHALYSGGLCVVQKDIWDKQKQEVINVIDQELKTMAKPKKKKKKNVIKYVPANNYHGTDLSKPIEHNYQYQKKNIAEPLPLQQRLAKMKEFIKNLDDKKKFRRK